jgi:GT2 family glycosyltransferase
VKADVVVPVYADAAMTETCLRSVLELSGDALGQLLVVDDCGPDPAMRPLLRRLRDEDPRVVLLENERNLGFVGSANRGLALRGGDAVLLNSDTRVTSGWLAELLEVSRAHERVAAVVPLSNHGTLCSVPEYQRAVAPERLEGLKLEGLEPRFTELPTGVGFCLLLRHEVLQLIGLLDPAYGRGYHEENDWCQRAAASGFVTLRAHRALVFHLGSASFGEEKAGLDRNNLRLLLHRYPYYVRMNQQFDAGPVARVAAHAVKARLGELRVAMEPAAEPELTKALAAQAVEASPAAEPERIEALAAQAVEASPAPAGGAAPGHAPSAQLRHWRRLPRDSAELAQLLGATEHAVVSVDDLRLFLVPGPQQEARAEQRALGWAALQAAQAVVVPSEYARRVLSEELGVERVSVVPPAVRAQPPSAEEAQAAETFAPPGPFYLCRGEEHLSLVLAAHALLQARRAETPALLVLSETVEGGAAMAGRPNDSSRARGAVSAHRDPASASPLQAGARLRDRSVSVPGDDRAPLAERSGARLRDHWIAAPLPAGARRVPAELARALCVRTLALIHPLVHDAHGSEVLEAMAAGAPVIALSSGALPELLGDAASFLREPTPEALAVELERLFDSPPLREQRRAAGHLQTAGLSLAEHAAGLARVYRQTLEAVAPGTLLRRQMLNQLLGTRR